MGVSFLQQLSSPSKNIFEISLAKAHIFLSSLLLVKGLSQLKHIILLQINTPCLCLEGYKPIHICRRCNDLVFLVHCRSTGVEITDYQSSSSSIFIKMRKKDGNGNKYIFPCCKLFPTKLILSAGIVHTRATRFFGGFTSHLFLESLGYVCVALKRIWPRVAVFCFGFCVL